MCFLSVYKLKYLISIGIVVTLLLGVALLYVLVYSFIISSVTIQVQSDFRTILIVLFLSTSLLMILSSLSGIYGLVRKKNQFVVFYAVTMGVYMLSFLVLGVGTSVTPEYITQQCQNQQSSTYEQTAQAGAALLCKQDCMCYYTNSQGYSQEQLKSMGIINYNSDNKNLPINVQNCRTWNNNSYPLTNQLDWLEMFFNCTGWCELDANPPYYLFSNINFGVPNGGTCVESVSNFMYTFGHIILIASFSVFSFIFLLLVVICCLCLHPDRGLKYDSLEIFKKSLIFINDSQSNAESEDQSFTE